MNSWGHVLRVVPSQSWARQSCILVLMVGTVLFFALTAAGTPDLLLLAPALPPPGARPSVLRPRWTAKIPRAKRLRDNILKGGVRHDLHAVQPHHVEPVFAPVFGSALALFWVIVSFAQIEEWPISHIPMYSTYVGHGKVAGVPWDDFAVATRVQEHARRCQKTQCQWSEIRHFGRNGRAWLQVTAPSGESRTLTPRDLKTMIWRRTEGLIQQAIIHDFAAKPTGRLAFQPDEPEYPATAFLRRIAPRIQALLGNEAHYERLELVYRLHDGDVVVASTLF